MGQKIIPIMLLLVLLLTACNSGNTKDKADDTALADSVVAPSDSMLYGLACEGSTDSVLLFLPGEGGDPVEYDMSSAKRNNMVLGYPQTGDFIAIIPDGVDNKKVSMVIDIDQLKGTWLRKVRPEIDASYEEMLRKRETPQSADSILSSMLVEREYGFSLKRQNVAEYAGVIADEKPQTEESPVKYPEPVMYSEWRIENGKLILTSSTLADEKHPAIVKRDTASILLLMKDSLVLMINNEQKAYYRK